MAFNFTFVQPLGNRGRHMNFLNNDIVNIIVGLFLFDGLLFARLIIQHHLRMRISIIIILVINIIVVVFYMNM